MIQKLNHLKDKIQNINKKYLYAGMIICVIFLSAYIVIWNMIAYMMGQKIVGYIDNWRDKKINMTLYDYNISGFPFGFTVELDKLIYQNAQKTFGWTSQTLKTTPLSYINNDIIISANTPHYFSYRTAGEQKTISVLGENMNIMTRIHNNIPSLFYISSDKTKIHFKNKNVIFYTDDIDIKLYNDKMILKDTLENIIAFDVNVKKIIPMPYWQNILETDFKKLSAHIYMRNPNKIENLRDLPDYMMRSYDNPEIIIDNIQLRHKLSDITITGFLTLNKDTGLNGDMMMVVSDYRKIIDMLQKKSVMTPEFAAKMRNMFSFLVAKNNTQKSHSQLQINLTVRDNIVYFNSIKVFNLLDIFF